MPPTSEVLGERNRGKLGPVVLLVTHVVPLPPTAGNEIRILKLIAWLRDQGWFVILQLRVQELPPDVVAALEQVVDRLVLLPRDPKVSGKSRRAASSNPLVAAVSWRLAGLRQRALAMPAVARFMIRRKPDGGNASNESAAVRTRRLLCPPALVETTRQLCDEYSPKAVIVEYIFLSKCLDAAPAGSLKVIDTIDLFSEKQIGVLAHGIDDPLACTPEEEREYLLKADLVIAIQAREAVQMARLVPERRVITVGIDFEVSKGLHQECVVPGRVLVVGSDNPMNVHGLQTFLASAWPAIAAQCPWASLRIAGKIGTGVDGSIARVELAGWVESLSAEYAAADVVINPVVAGTGLKIKTVEALCHGSAVVAYPNGVDGLARVDPPAFLVADSGSAFAASVIGLLRDSAVRAGLQQAALSYAREQFDRETVYAPLKKEFLVHFAPSQSAARAARLGAESTATAGGRGL